VSIVSAANDCEAASVPHRRKRLQEDPAICFKHDLRSNCVVIFKNLKPARRETVQTKIKIVSPRVGLRKS